MTSKLKCPVCGKTELIRMFNPLTGEYFEDYDCPFRLCNFRGNKVAVDALIQAKQDLKTAQKALKDARIFADTHCIATAVKTIDKALETIGKHNE